MLVFIYSYLYFIGMRTQHTAVMTSRAVAVLVIRILIWYTECWPHPFRICWFFFVKYVNVRIFGVLVVSNVARVQFNGLLTTPSTN